MKAQPEMVLDAPARPFTSERAASNFDDPAGLTATKARPFATPQFSGAVIGRLVALSGSGTPLVQFPGNPAPSALPAAVASPATTKDIGRDAILLFEHGNPCYPILMGFLHQPAPTISEASPVEVRLDGEQLRVTAKSELVLRCGKASITLTRAGKVLIRGAYLLSRSSGANRIKGGSVQIN
jgi:hypothetical protein